MANRTKIQSFRDLEIWNRSVDLVEKIYAATKSFPNDERYGLTAQIRKAAVSIPSNIAEGFGRFHNSEYKQFLFVSLGSCAEVITQLTIAARLDYLKKDTAQELMEELDQISRMTMNLIKKLNERG